MRRGWLVLAVAGLALSALAVSSCAALQGETDGDQLARLQASPQWWDGRFHNPQPLWSDASGAWRRLLFGADVPGRAPDAPVPVVTPDLAQPPASGLRVTWLGHSSALVEIDGRAVLTDPLWSERASPLPWVGPKRWFAPPLPLSALSHIDAVVISHDHADHLDRGSIEAMRGWRNRFIVPLGVGAQLRRWGILEARIVELDWWQSTHLGDLEVTATPSRHRSGRLLTSGDRTLWAGYALRGPRHRVWYSGDTGFHDQLADIGERLGPFDLTLIEAGQYDAHWPDTHLGPELAVEAHRRVRGQILLPVHWALISLAPHGWTEPAERVRAAAQCQGVSVLWPRPGEAVEPATAETAPWWPRLPWRLAAGAPQTPTRQGDPNDRMPASACQPAGSRTTVTVQSDSATTWPDTLPR